MSYTLLTNELINRIHEVDANFTEYNSVRSLQLQDGHFERKRVGQAILVRDRTRDSGYYNRVVGLAEAEIGRLDEIIGFHHEVEKDCTVSLTPDRATPKLLQALQQYGFSLAGYVCVFAAPCDAIQPPTELIEIRRAVRSDIDTIVELWGGELEPEVVERRADAQFVPEFPIYLAKLDGRMVAMGSMYVDEGIAWLGNAETLPDYRCRGSQLELLRYRALQAREMGCDWVMSDAEFGTASYRNIERVGMRLAYYEIQVCLPKPKGEADRGNAV